MEETNKTTEASEENVSTDNAEQKANPETKDTGKGIKVFNFFKRNPVLFTALIGLLAVVAVYFWKDIQGENKRAAMEEMAIAQLKTNNETMLKLMAKPLVWSIRTEMLRGNMEQVNIYTNELVKEKNFDFIYMVDPEGTIIVSTDKKLEGQPVGSRVEESLLKTDSVVVVNNAAGMLTMAAPVMGFDKRLAVIIMDYAAPGFKKDNKETLKIQDKK